MRDFFMLKFLIFVFCFTKLSLALLFNGFQIRDLYTNDDTFIADAEQWTATALRHGIPYNLCDGTYIIGGYDVLGYPDSLPGVQGYYYQRIYNDLPDHNIIYFTISLWLIDSWDADPPDIFQFQFDSVLVQGWTFAFGNFTTRLCGIADWADLANMTVFGQVSHSGPSLTLRVISQLDSFALDESLGFRDVNLIFAQSSESDVNEMCGLSPLPLPSNQCGCPYGEYFDNVYTFGCVSCDPNCASCFGPTSQECYECEIGYSSVNGECISCDESCADCFGPNANQCTNCPAGTSLFNGEICLSNCVTTSILATVLVCESPCLLGEIYDPDSQTCLNPCDDIGGFLYWDGTCNSLCEFPLQIDDDSSLCIFHCKPDEFLYWDGSCSHTCDIPLISNLYKNRLFCQSPCPHETDSIYWNGTCGSSCPSPYLSSLDEKAKYCNLPCSEEQPYWNGSSCLKYCNLPFVAREADDGILYCEYPCSSSEYLSWNGSCLDFCPVPYEACPFGPGMQFCFYLCKQYGEYYYPKEGQCLPTCDGLNTPEIQISLDGAWYVACVKKNMGKQPPADNAEDPPRGPFYFPITAIKIASEKAASIFIALDIVVSLLRDSHVMILILMIKILNFMRYVDVRIPPQLMQEIMTFDHNYYYLNFGPGMSEGMRGKFTKSPLPMVFERTGVHSRFLVNFFKPITSFLIVLGVIILIAILQMFLRRKSSHQYVLVKMILKRIEMFFKWNLVVALLICNVDEITLYGILEWKTITTGSDQDSISLLISLGMAVLSLIVIIAPFYLLDKIYQTRFKVLSNQANEPYFNLLKRIEGFQVLWKDFKDSSGPQKCFLPLNILRIALVYMIIGLLYKNPMLQMVLIFLISWGMLAYMSIVKPFMKKLDFIQSVLYEVCMLISTGSMLILAELDRAHANAEQLWIFLGDCIMFCSILISFTAIIFFIIKFSLEVQRIWKFYKTAPKPITLREFAILFLKEDDPVMQELNKNKRTSKKLDLTGFEREIERRNFERYNIRFTSPDISQFESNNDEVQLTHIPRKGDLRIRRSLFGVKIQNSDSESSPFKSTFDEVQSPRPAPKKIFDQTDIRKISQEFFSESLPIENEEKLDDSASLLQRNQEKIPPKRKVLWKGLETIKELDSLEASEIHNGLHTKRLGSVLQDPLRGDLSLLSAVNKRLSSETMMQKIEEVEIIKEKADIIKKKLTVKENASQEPLFE